MATVNPIIPLPNDMVSESTIKFTRLSKRLIVKLLSINIGNEIILKLGVKKTVNVNIDSEVNIFITKLLNLVI